MRLKFIPTLGGNHFYIGDDDDDNAPMLTLNFVSEFASLPRDVKEKVAFNALKNAVREMRELMDAKEAKYNPSEGI